MYEYQQLVLGVWLEMLGDICCEPAIPAAMKRCLLALIRVSANT